MICCSLMKYQMEMVEMDNTVTFNLISSSPPNLPPDQKQLYMNEMLRNPDVWVSFHMDNI